MEQRIMTFREDDGGGVPPKSNLGPEETEDGDASRSEHGGNPTKSKLALEGADDDGAS